MLVYINPMVFSYDACGYGNCDGVDRGCAFHLYFFRMILQLYSHHLFVVVVVVVVVVFLLLFFEL